MPTQHNHMTRDIKPPGACPGCDNSAGLDPARFNGKTTETIVADALAFMRCKETNPKAEDPIFGYYQFSAEQRAFLTDEQRPKAREIMDALDGVGTQQWGTRDRDGRVQRWEDEREAKDMAHGMAQRLVTRRTGEWVAVDGW